MSRWQRFWFQEGGQYATALVRMGLAAAVIATVHKLGVSDYVADRARRPLHLYDPDGIMMLLGGEPPSPKLLNFLKLVAYTSASMMLIGLASRT
ncbi:MAG: hypothetical protein KJO07_08380, partial [Deltaproteobacteria bacterium]|nr:hypothetical protein [Deltaproteobacteria bacterium]